MTVCPKCNGRATKLLSLTTGLLKCQQCDHEWTGTRLHPVPEQIQADYNAAVQQREEWRARDRW
jgi:ribosomal protein L37AE/L43A